MPDAASNNLLGVPNNATTPAAFNTQQSSITLPPSGTTNTQLSGLAIGIFPNASTPTFLAAAVAGLSAPQITGQLYAQLSVLGVNSVGQQGLNFQNNLAGFAQNAFGFGSGTQPNQPWVPNAYNLGLANGQGAYPSQADFGFQPAAPGARQFGLHNIRFEENNADTDPDEQAAPHRTFRAAHERAENSDPAGQIAVDDEDAASEKQSDPNSDVEARPIPLIPHAATKSEAAVGKAALFSNEADDPDAVPHAAQTSWHEEDVFLGTLSAQRVHDSDALDVRNESSRAPSALLREKDPFVMENGEEVIPALHRLNLSSTFALSVLTPAQFMALLVEPPTPAVPMDGGEEAESLDEPE